MTFQEDDREWLTNIIAELREKGSYYTVRALEKELDNIGRKPLFRGKELKRTFIVH